jgi:hypothetical protein
MMSATAVPSDATWLQAPNYEVLPLNSMLAGRVPEVRRALQLGVPAYADLSRSNFYDVELTNGWAYVHVRDDNRTVYLVAYSHA